jgi:hypothetical protein
LAFTIVVEVLRPVQLRLVPEAVAEELPQSLPVVL